MTNKHDEKELKINYLCVDFDKAAKTTNAAYMFRLMFAANDLITIGYLDEQVNSDKQARPVLSDFQLGSQSYMLRLLAGHLVEACNAFVLRVPTQGTSREGKNAMASIIKQNSTIKKLFAHLCELKLDPKFEQLGKVRNAFAFHYNYQEEGLDTHNAIQQCLNELKVRSSGDAHGWIQTANKEGPYFRFLLGDEVMHTAMRMVLGEIPDSDNYKNDTKANELRIYIGKLTTAFLDFAHIALLDWVKQNKLAKPGIQPPSKGTKESVD